MDIDNLSAGLRRISYPPQLQMVDRGIRGEGFYPGAAQCLFGDGSPQIMLLGRDFGTLAYYEKLAALAGRSEYALTWRHTRSIYLTELAKASLFCTNYLMGVRVDGSAKGDLSARMTNEEWKAFEESCWVFLQRQIQTFEPDLILVFGSDNRRDLDQSLPLRQIGTPMEFGPHPHSAIGSKNQEPHLEVCRRIRTRFSL